MAYGYCEKCTLKGYLEFNFSECKADPETGKFPKCIKYKIDLRKDSPDEDNDEGKGPDKDDDDDKKDSGEGNSNHHLVKGTRVMVISLER